MKHPPKDSDKKECKALNSNRKPGVVSVDHANVIFALSHISGATACYPGPWQQAAISKSWLLPEWHRSNLTLHINQVRTNNSDLISSF